MSPPSQSRDTLLVIEDDADIRESLIDLLKDAGHAVFTAGDGTEALRMLDAGAIPRPCLVLLDWLMKPMSGQQFLESIQDRSDAADLRVLIVSAATDLHHCRSPQGRQCRSRSRSTSSWSASGLTVAPRGPGPRWPEPSDALPRAGVVTGRLTHVPAEGCAEGARRTVADPLGHLGN